MTPQETYAYLERFCEEPYADLPDDLDLIALNVYPVVDRSLTILDFCMRDDAIDHDYVFADVRDGYLVNIGKDHAIDVLFSISDNLSLPTAHLEPRAWTVLQQLDESWVGTPNYMGIAWFWHIEYKHQMRDSSPLVRRRVHTALVAAGLSPKEISPEHDVIVYRYARPDMGNGPGGPQPPPHRTAEEWKRLEKTQFQGKGDVARIRSGLRLTDEQ